MSSARRPAGRPADRPAADSAAQAGGDPLTRLPKDGTLLVFEAPWCVPALLLAGHLEALAESGVPVRRVDIDTWPQHAESFRVISLPTLVWVRGGAERRRHVGAAGPGVLRKFTARR